MGFRDYKELKVWHKPMDLVVECYKVTRNFPKSESYGLTSQLQRAAVSIPANIAEGNGRQYGKEFKQFLYVAYGSLAELETHLQIALRLEYLDEPTLNQLLLQTAEIGRMLNGLEASLKISPSDK